MRFNRTTQKRNSGDHSIEDSRHEVLTKEEKTPGYKTDNYSVNSLFNNQYSLHIKSKSVINIIGEWPIPNFQNHRFRTTAIAVLHLICKH